MGRRRRGVMSESFKYELAKDLGFYEVVQKEGWEGIRTKDAGNMVKRAIEIAEQHLANQHQGQQLPYQPQLGNQGQQMPQQRYQSQQAASVYSPVGARQQANQAFPLS